MGHPPSHLRVLGDTIIQRLRTFRAAVHQMVILYWRAIVKLAKLPIPVTRTGAYLVGIFILVGTAMLEGYPFVPAPGVAIGLLGLAAVVVAVRAESLRLWEKVGWICVASLLFYVEVHSIYVERDQHDREQAHSRAEQIRQFAEIAKGIDKAIAESQKQFKATMERVDTTLKTSERTLRNTKPNAALEFQAILIFRPSLPFRANHELELNVYFTNSGNDSAKNSYWDAKLYVRRPDSVQDQRQITDEFNKWWKNSTHQGGGSNVPPHSPSFFSFKTHQFTEQEIKGVLDHTLTLYILVRFTWSDQTGNWVGDECSAYQDPTHDLSVSHPCKSHDNPRYRAN